VVGLVPKIYKHLHEFKIMLKNYLSLIRFDKPVGTLLLLWPTLISLVVASHGIPPVYTIIVFSLGVFLTRSAGCAINDIIDTKFDREVERTRNRPLANGTISKTGALILVAFLSCLAFILAYKYLHRNTLYLTIPALLIFVSYPYMKRFFPVPQAYLGIAFSIGILMAFIEVNGRLNAIAGLLFVANMFWVVGYDTIYAMVDMKDDLKIGIKTSAITFGSFVIPAIAVCYTIYFLLLFWLGSLLQLNVVYYLGLSLAGGLMVYQVIILLMRDEAKYFSMFLLNNWVGLILFIAILAGMFG
jgi:4-hydroxybenzoate polyprenyltransferase